MTYWCPGTPEGHWWFWGVRKHREDAIRDLVADLRRHPGKAVVDWEELRIQGWRVEKVRIVRAEG